MTHRLGIEPGSSDPNSNAPPTKTPTLLPSTGKVLSTQRNCVSELSYISYELLYILLFLGGTRHDIDV